IKRRGRILEKSQQGRIGDRAGFVLGRPALVSCTRCNHPPKLKEWLPLVKRTSSLPVNKFNAFAVGSFPFATTIPEAAAVLTPPPMVIWPGTRPVMNARFAGIGTAGDVTTGEYARVKPPLRLFRKVGEKTCVSCNETTWLRARLIWVKFVSALGSILSPSEIR